jgi:CP family cyanate transporter-like MFS transporter
MPPPLRDPLSHARPRRALLVAGILLIAFNLRPMLASVGPLVGQIRADTGLSSVALGLLTTLPLIAFGIVSNLAPAVTRALGFGGALTAALVLISLGGGVRGLGASALLFGGTALLGVGIALGNVLLPALVKRDFAHRSGSMTSLYSSVMAVGASVAAGVSVPLSRPLGWRGVLAMWALPAVVALIVWLPQVRRSKAMGGEERGERAPSRSLWRCGLAWQVALFMGLQSLTFYVLLAWLPDLLVSRGMDAGHAGWLLALSQATGILGSATVPILAGRRPDQRSAIVAMGMLEGIALAGLLFEPLAALTLLWVSIIGFALGATFGLALLFLVLRSADTRTTTQLSGMAQSVGYTIAAAGPVVVGFLYDVTAGWRVPLLFLVLVWVGKVWTGVQAASARTIGG